MEYNLPEPNNTDTLNYADGYNEDIRKTIHKNFPVAVEQTRAFASQFAGSSARETAHNIWKFIKDHCIYKKDDPDKQCIKLPSRFIHENGYSDCKSFALTAAALLANNRLPVSFRYANYRGGSIPSHVYTVTSDENGKEIIVDAVWKYFNSEKKPTYKFDAPMKVYTLSGFSDLATAIKTAGSSDAAIKHPQFWKFFQKAARHKGLDLAKIKATNPEKFEQMRSKAWQFFQTRKKANRLKGKLYSGTLPQMIRGIEDDFAGEDIGSFFGSIFSGIKKVVSAPFKLAAKGVKAAGKGLKAAGKFAWAMGKKLALAPARNAFRGIVHINFKGLAQKLKRVNEKDPQGLKKKWESLGGSYSALLKSVRHGYNHWAKNHNKGPMTGLYGCDLPILYNHAVSMGIHSPDDDGIGFAPALIGLAGAVLLALGGLLKKHGGDPEAEAAGKESSTDDILQAAQDGVMAFNSSLPANAPQLDFIDPTQNPGQFDFQKGIDDTPASEAGFSLNLPTILLFGGGAALLLGMRGRK